MARYTIAITLTLQAIALSCILVPCLALLDELSPLPRSLQALDGFTIKQLNQNAAALQENLDYFGLYAAANNTCPVCDNDNGNDAAKSMLSQASISTSVVAKRLKQTSTWESFGRATRTRRGKRRYNQSVSSTSTDGIVSILTETGSHFAALANRARKQRRDAKIASPSVSSSRMADDMLNVLEQLATTSATVANDMAGTLQDKRGGSGSTATAGIVATTMLSLLTFLERVTLPSTSLLVDYLQVAVNGEYIDRARIDANLATLRTSLSNNATLGVFGEAIRLLSAHRDDDISSGLLRTTLTKLTLSMSSLDNSLVQLVASVKDNKAIQDSKPDKTVGAVAAPFNGDELIVQVSGLITGIVLASVNAMQRIALDSLDSSSRSSRNVLVSAAGLYVQVVESILNQALATINAILTVARSSSSSSDYTSRTTGGRGPSNVVVSGDTILYWICQAATDFEGELFGPCSILLIPWIIVTSPVTLPLAIIIFLSRDTNALAQTRLSRTTGSSSNSSCYQKALACQNQALSAALLPSI